MPIRRDFKLEKYIDDASRKNEFQPLEDIVQNENYINVTQKCSKHFFTKFDTLICRELENKEVRNVSTLLNVIQRFAKSLSINGEDGFPSMINQGLVQKMVTWFDKSKEILTCDGVAKDEDLINLVEDFFDTLMIVHDINNDGKIEMLENFTLRTCSLIADTRMNVFIQQEAVRKLNVMLDTMPRETRKKILSTEELLPVMNNMGKRILDAGDYDLQVAITEALCRMTSEKQRAELATHWFSMEFVTNAFKGIKDSDFETDCRKFLNQVNGMLGSKRRVFTYPCLSAFLETHELQMPSDEKLEEFWIDFNLGSRSVSFYIAADDNGEERQWDTVCVPEDEVSMYNVEGKDVPSKKLLQIFLKTSIKVGCKEGSNISIYFDSALDIFEVTRKIYGATKCKGFFKKQAISVAKTAVHVIFDESGSQIFIPESQVSPSVGKDKCSSEVEDKRNMDVKHHSDASDQKQVKTQEASMITPSKRKMSEATMIIPSTGGFTVRSPLLTARTSTPQNRRVKPPLKMVNSAEDTVWPFNLDTKSEFAENESTGGHLITRGQLYSNNTDANHDMNEEYSKKNDVFENANDIKRSRSKTQHFQKCITAAEVADMLQNEEKDQTYQKESIDEKRDVVPDSQPVRRKDKPLLPGLKDGYFDEQKQSTKHTSLISDKFTSNSVKWNSSKSSGPTFQQDNVFSDRVVKQQAFYSIFEGKDSPKQGKEIQDKYLKSEQPQEEVFGELTNANTKTFTSKSVEKHSEQTSFNTNALKKKERTDFGTKSETSCRFMCQTRAVQRFGESPKMSTLVKNSNNNSVSCKTETISRRSLPKTLPEFPSVHRESKQRKEKSHNFMVATESLINTIGCRYPNKGSNKSTRQSEKAMAVNKSFADESVLLSNKANGRNRSFRQFTTINLNLTRDHLMDDIYSFNLSGTEEPTIKLADDDIYVTKQKSCASLSSKMKQEMRRSEAKVKSAKKPRNHHGSKHLFSDTDSETRCDDSKTDISWLREVNRKQKPQLLGYRRNKKVRKAEMLQEDISSEKSLAKSVPKGKTQVNKLLNKSKPQTKVDERTTEQTISKRPQRTTVNNKSYKELSNSELESEEESKSPCPLTAKTFLAMHCNAGEKQRKTWPVLDNPKKENAIKEFKANQKQASRSRKLGKPTEFSPLKPTYVEKMRSDEYYSESEFARIPSSFLTESSPGNESLNDISGISTKKFYSAVIKKYDKSLMKSMDSTLNKQRRDKEDSSPEFSPLSLPTLTPPAMDKSASSGVDIDISMPGFMSSYNKEDPLLTSNYISVKEPFQTELKSLGASMLQSVREESQPLSHVSSLSESKEKPWNHIPHSTTHVSGPTTRTTSANLKRMYHNESESDNNESRSDEKEQEGDDDINETLHPKKQLKVTVQDQVTCRVSESISTVSGNEISVIDCDSWEAGSSDVGMMCQKISKQFTRKIQNRSRKIDYFTKQSLKSAQQHMTAMNFQIRECRINRLDNFQCAVLEELEHFEKDSQSLKHMEKEFAIFLKQQTSVFDAYCRSEQQRIHHLKSSFENVFESLDFEENIFTSEMHLMREDMKLVQERLLKEVQEEELLNIRRGLQSLFMAGTRKF